MRSLRTSAGGVGVVQMRTGADKGGGGVKIGRFFADVLCARPPAKTRQQRKSSELDNSWLTFKIRYTDNNQRNFDWEGNTYTLYKLSTGKICTPQ